MDKGTGKLRAGTPIIKFKYKFIKNKYFNLLIILYLINYIVILNRYTGIVVIDILNFHVLLSDVYYSNNNYPNI